MGIFRWHFGLANLGSVFSALFYNVRYGLSLTTYILYEYNAYRLIYRASVTLFSGFGEAFE